MSQLSEYLKKHSTGEDVIEIGSEKFRCLIVYPSVEPRLDGFVGVDKSERLVFISAAVPDQYRFYFLFHEIVESYVLQENASGKCLSALNAELAVVPKGTLSLYLPYRRDFFARLVVFLTYIDLSRGEDFTKSVLASYEELCRLCVKLPK